MAPAKKKRKKETPMGGFWQLGPQEMEQVYTRQGTEDPPGKWARGTRVAFLPSLPFLRFIWK